MKPFSKCHRQPPRDLALKCNLWSYFKKFVYFRASSLALLQDTQILQLVGYFSSLLCSQCTAHNTSSLDKQQGTGKARFNSGVIGSTSSASQQNFLKNSKTSGQLYYEGKGKCFHSCCKIYLNFHLFSTLEIPESH